MNEKEEEIVQFCEFFCRSFRFVLIFANLKLESSNDETGKQERDANNAQKDLKETYYYLMLYLPALPGQSTNIITEPMQKRMATNENITFKSM